MKKFGFRDFVIKPIMLSDLTFFIIFFFFPSFSNKYLNVGFSLSSDTSDKVDDLSDNIKNKTGVDVNDMLDSLDTDDLSQFLN